MHGGEPGEREGSKEWHADCGGHWEAGKLLKVLEQSAELWSVLDLGQFTR